MPFDEQVPSGKHTVTVFNRVFDYRSTSEVVVAAGGTLTFPIPEVKTGTIRMTVAADSSADVEINGRKVCQTPCEPFSLALGHHTLHLSNKELGKSTDLDVLVVEGETKVKVPW